MEEHEYLCAPCRNGRKVVYPIDDRELCPILDWHSTCPDCGQPMTRIPPELDDMEARIFKLGLIEKHHGPLDPDRLDLDGVKRELARRNGTGVAREPSPADPAPGPAPAAGP